MKGLQDACDKQGGAVSLDLVLWAGDEDEDEAILGDAGQSGLELDADDDEDDVEDDDDEDDDEDEEEEE